MKKNIQILFGDRVHKIMFQKLFVINQNFFKKLSSTNQSCSNFVKYKDESFFKDVLSSKKLSSEGEEMLKKAIDAVKAEMTK